MSSVQSATDIAMEKAARSLKKQGSLASSSVSQEYSVRLQKRHGSMSTISFMDEPHGDNMMHPPVRMENTFQLQPYCRFPDGQVRNIIREVLEGYLAEERYEPELCRQMTKTLSEVVKARVKDLGLARYKVICIVHIGQLKDQTLRMGSRCLWDPKFDTFASFEFRNKSLFAVGTVYAIYAD
ncbi:hypothetical protein NP493_43g02015 [Ridgeia piscesae]|uniref:Uncharacterized protein n=1 Tax=Ridgeia piscesae TaxID=27915 RepID=A0AAD9PBV2_RIDPI|nr:hypothetical protein NP493_43g02015 [Ridgeia piscesae]